MAKPKPSNSGKSGWTTVELGSIDSSGVHHPVQVLVLDSNEVQGFLGGDLVVSRHGGHRFPDVEHFVPGHHVAVSQRPRAEMDVGEVPAGDDSPDAGQTLGFRGVDADDAGVAAGAGQHLAHQHFGQVDIAGVSSVARDFVRRVNPDVVFAQHFELWHLLYSAFRPIASAAAMAASTTLE